MVPGGLGLFEKVIFLLLAPHAPADTVLGKLLFFGDFTTFCRSRLQYYSWVCMSYADTLPNA